MKNGGGYGIKYQQRFSTLSFRRGDMSRSDRGGVAESVICIDITGFYTIIDYAAVNLIRITIYEEVKKNIKK